MSFLEFPFFTKENCNSLHFNRVGIIISLGKYLIFEPPVVFINLVIISEMTRAVCNSNWPVFFMVGTAVID